jgi:hypothetical protein
MFSFSKFTRNKFEFHRRLKCGIAGFKSQHINIRRGDGRWSREGWAFMVARGGRAGRSSISLQAESQRGTPQTLAEA